MGRAKQLNVVVQFGNTPYVINDLGFDKSPRFELYNKNTKQIEAKSNDPRTFDDIVWKKESNNAEFSETPERRRGRRKKKD